MDIEDTRRQEVIDYVQGKYGADHVSRIITFGTLAARQAVRDVGKALGVNQFTLDTACKTIPAKPKITIDKALEESPDFKNIYDSDREIQNVVNVAKRLEGLSRHKSQHACGVIIAKNPVSDTVPEVIMKDKSGLAAPTAAFNMVELENLGLMKMDFLGLRNMGVLSNCCEMVGIAEGDINLYDPVIYEHISLGHTDGIFQIESGGMKNLMQQMFWDVESRRKKYASENDQAALDALGHECFERLVAAISLYRPGPMDYIPDYIAGMRNPDKIHYDCPELEPILSKTYGVIVYQEQVQQICRSLAGYTLGHADVVRRANLSPAPKEMREVPRG